MSEKSTAVVFESPGHVAVREVELPDCDPADCIVEVEWSGVSTGTERLLWDGRMPPFPGLSYPLVPGYESVGRVVSCGPNSTISPGTRVFVPGSRGFTDVEGVFGGAAKRLVVNSERLVPLADEQREEAVLLALVATAIHALRRLDKIGKPDLIVGHGVLGRLIARLTELDGSGDLQVWETEACRRTGNFPYLVSDPSQAPEGNFNVICDVSGDSNLLDQLITRLKPQGTILLAGFYHAPLSFQFPPAFMREASIVIAAEWQPEDLQEAGRLLREGLLNIDDLITHRFAANDAEPAYQTAFSDPECLKLILDWRSL